MEKIEGTKFSNINTKNMFYGTLTLSESESVVRKIQKISNFLLYFLKVISFKKQNRTQCYGPPNIPEFLTTGVPLWKKSKVQNFRI